MSVSHDGRCRTLELPIYSHRLDALGPCKPVEPDAIGTVFEEKKGSIMRHVDVLIVGSGPAGMSTALHLCALDPAWAERMVVLDAAEHPRDKLCGGGVTHHGAEVLARLGLAFEPAHVRVGEIRFLFEDRTLRLPESRGLRITRRDEFDHWLVACGQARGIEIRQGEPAVDVAPIGAQPAVATGWPPSALGFAVVTPRDEYRAAVLVVADGSKSFVKRRLGWGEGEALRSARLIEILTPEVARQRFEFQDGVAVFDFTPLVDGLQGYYWDFPSRVAGVPHMNRGVFDSRVRRDRPRASLKAVLGERLARRGLDLSDHPIEGHPIHGFHPEAELARPRAILVGDAAGADPLFGEGISFALAYGEVAAETIAAAFAGGDFAFRDYRGRVGSHRLLRQLRWRRMAARGLYAAAARPRAARAIWRAAEAVAPAALGLDAARRLLLRPWRQ